ncbi:SBBP repeat-containing protein [Leptolyngbya ohadii]|uniref:SBBP repeat-containing protein n=1 Tax=Leptolyngbya ohadii TaxID=1962290 RepID=UPI000B59BAC2|nr:SBBP repeat-containing protein [Leptolyngbya ohadii]
MPADRLGNRLQAARNLGSLATPVSIRDGLGGRDQNDVARFRLSGRSTVSLQVNGLRKGSAIGVDLFAPKSPTSKPWRRLTQTDLGRLRSKDLQQQVNFVSRSRISGSGSVNVTLDAGEYYLRLSARKGTTSYRLVASATLQSSPIIPPNSQPPSLPPGSPPPPPALRFTQNWVRQFGTSANDYAYGVAVNGDRVFVAGSTNGGFGVRNAGDRDSYVARLDTQGSPPTIRQFGRPGTDVAADIVADSEGNYYVSGVNVLAEPIPVVGGTYLNPNGYTAKFTPAATESWRQSIATDTTNPIALGPDIEAADSVSRIAIDAQGNLYVTGLLRGVPNTLGFSRPSQAFVAKYNTNGGRQWISELNLSGSSSGIDIAVDALGNAYITGVTNATLSPDINDPLKDGDAFVAKLDASGAVLWQQTIASTSTDIGGGVAVDSIGNVYITGDTLGTLPEQTSAGGGDAFLARFDANGSRQWLKQFGTAQLDESQAIAIDAQDRIYLTGETTGALFGNAVIGQADAWLAAFNTNGTLLGSTQVGTPQNDEAYGLAIVNPAPTSLPNSPPLIYLVGQTQGTFPNGGTTNQGNFDAWAAQYSLSPV